MRDGSRRFTDREVTLILHEASELDEREGRDAEGALSTEDLRQIAREVGISPGAVDRAIASLGRPRAPSGWTGEPLVRRAVHEVPFELDREGLSRLIRIVDEHADEAGSVTEALGAVRWTADDRLSTRQVSLAPGDGRTLIRVVEKIRPRVRRVFHLLPAAWGAMLAGPAVSALEPTAAGIGGLLAAGVFGGAALGRLAWTVFSGRSAARVSRWAELLAREAEAPESSGGRPSGSGRPRSTEDAY